MSRWVYVTFLFACVICVTQAFPQAAELETTTAAPSGLSLIILDYWKKVMELNPGMMDDPKIQKAFEDAGLLHYLMNVTTTATSLLPENPNES